jgi:hypothetical protein
MLALLVTDRLRYDKGCHRTVQTCKTWPDPGTWQLDGRGWSGSTASVSCATLPAYFERPGVRAELILHRAVGELVEVSPGTRVVTATAEREDRGNTPGGLSMVL